MNFITNLKLIFSIFPQIIAAVKTIEEAIPQGGSGSQKLSLIYNILTVAYEQSNKAFGTFDQVWPIISSTVQATVAAFNATGIFKK